MKWTGFPASTRKKHELIQLVSDSRKLRDDVLEPAGGDSAQEPEARVKASCHSSQAFFQ